MDVVDLRRWKLPDRGRGVDRGPGVVLLGLLAVVYGCAIWLWRRLPAGAQRLGAPVVSVGSVLVGGTGKTPVTMLLAEGLAARGYKVCILSRGYRRKVTRSPLVVSDGRRILASVEEAGDEPHLLARRLPQVGVVVSRNRVEAAREAARAFAPDLFLLDDGFQVRSVAKDVEIVTADSTALQARQALLPAGRLREGWSAVRPEHLGVVLVGAAGERPASGPLRAGKVFYAFRQEPTVLDVEGRRVERRTAAGTPVAIVSGIASPAGFEETCRRAGLSAAVSVRASDHHWYDKDDVALVKSLMSKYGCERIVTTEKDIAKLPADLSERAWTVRADVALDEPGVFWQELEARLGKRG